VSSLSGQVEHVSLLISATVEIKEKQRGGNILGNIFTGSSLLDTLTHTAHSMSSSGAPNKAQRRDDGQASILEQASKMVAKEAFFMKRAVDKNELKVVLKHGATAAQKLLRAVHARLRRAAPPRGLLCEHLRVF
jgi:hypothetical protein